MKKRTVFFLAALLFSSSLVFAAVGNSELTLNAHVRGITIHGFVQSLPEGGEYDAFTVLTQLVTLQELEALEGPTDALEKAQNLALDYTDIEDFDFGDDAYEGVAYYLFLSNMTTAVGVSFTVSDFVHDVEQSIVVPWELGVAIVASDELTIIDGEKKSGTTVHPIATATSPLAIRWGILKLSLYFEPLLGYISGDYTATVVASITAS